MDTLEPQRIHEPAGFGNKRAIHERLRDLAGDADAQQSPMILVIAEQRDGILNRAAWEAAGNGRK